MNPRDGVCGPFADSCALAMKYLQMCISLRDSIDYLSGRLYHDFRNDTIVSHGVE